MTANIALSRIHFPVTTLGPGRRIGIWFQGCSIRCPGCISMDTWAPGRGITTIDEVVNAVTQWLPSADGITISGGEPFDQPVALLDLLRRLRSLTEADVLVFTGHPWTKVRETVDASSGLIDALVTGPFDVNQSQTLALRGSDNQELRFLTAMGHERFAPFQRPITEVERTLDVMFDDRGDVWFAGIPGRDDFRRLREMLEKAGARLSTSDDKRPSSGGMSVR
ncbi:4Fe-4S cluster-binding domain-containing protein [Bradyrhizobium sp. CSA112]|jgi:anaerobic ribonucleoside-triphosphate reductase activating protein|uniref:4Fe-4S cluster-binding domain-containing protein n=1 Tax=Bradyrhizobium sp. CSA112 TaxID=2699170 RepID=UPI0023AF4AC2|nr:4Fe-4S cluster-binding domain-containing protein [Bradyrhizobium sp. CSA112]MDE5454211.1 4Fe-4S cluster-binding domain-containing protein [Bradyrhizobium sp. CSA112]